MVARETPQGLGDLGGALAFGAARPRCGELVGVHNGGPAPDPMGGAGRREAGHRALVDEVSFQLSERGHQ